MMFLFLFFLFFSSARAMPSPSSARYCMAGRNPLLESAAAYIGLASSNMSSLAEIDVRRLLIDFGKFLMIVGGWLEAMLRYRGVSPGFLYGL